MHKFFPVYVRNITVNVSVLLSLQDTRDYFYFFFVADRIADRSNLVGNVAWRTVKGVQFVMAKKQ